MKTPRRASVATVLAALVTLTLAPLVTGADSPQVKTLFAHPTREYSTAPLWVWNDELTDQQIRGTLRDLAAQQVKQVFVHPRPGLMTPYLSPEWFRLWKVALDEAAKLDMNCWIYDENSYPSGFAGGWVPEQMPEARGRGLQLKAASTAPAWSPDTFAVFALQNGTSTDVTAAARAGTLPPKGSYVVATILRTPNRPWNADRPYVDLLYPGVTEKFLNVTLDAYQREVGREFGRRIPGSFTDEPEIRPAGGLPWTDDLPQQFQQRRGYDLTASLASLHQEVGDWRRVRHDFFATLNALFIERWAKPYHDWCAQHGLAFTGHYWDHEWPGCTAVPDNMAMAAWQQVPGIDCLMNQYREDTRGQFGNARMVRELASVANQLGRSRRLCELYGAGGWDLRFEDMKRIGDWLGVLGVNLFDEHLSYITLRGARKRDHPQSFSYHEPWWEAYHVNASYLARLSVALSHGEQLNRILVLEPTTTAWMYQGNAPKLKELGDSFFNLVMALERAQVEYDLGSEDIIARHGQVGAAGFVVGHRTYTTVVLPSGTENLDAPTVALLEKFAAHGGKILACGEPPARLDGAPSDRVATLARAASWQQITSAALPAALLATPADRFAVRRAADDQGVLFHQRRTLDDGQLLFLVNSSLEHPSRGVIESDAKGVEVWDLTTGTTRPYTFAADARGLTAGFTLPPSGSLLLFLSSRAIAPAPAVSTSRTTVEPTGPLAVRRIGPNVLTLDHVDITAGGETRTDFYCYAANQFAFQKNGLPRNPWDSAVQFRDEIITRTFAADSGFSATYRFTIAGRVPADLAIVIERPDLYRITCNGQPISAKPGAWWLDQAFGKIAIADVARIGDNAVTITAAPFTIRHELEPAYVLGDFSLRATAKGFVIEPPQPLHAGRWNEQGLPFYAQGVAYTAAFKVNTTDGRHVVSLPSWLGSVAKVIINGQPAGYIAAPPWECDVSALVRAGENTIEVVAIGTLKNTLGPHHGNPPAGTAWPRSFQTAPKGGLPRGTDYSTIGYGLFAPFQLHRTSPTTP